MLKDKGAAFSKLSVWRRSTEEKKLPVKQESTVAQVESNDPWTSGNCALNLPGK
jgi:hypothetical protein